MSDDYTITDFSDHEIKVGTTVRMWWDPKMEVQPGDGDFGVVTDLGEWEGDVDDEGRSIGIPPHVEVKWENGKKTHFVTSEWVWDRWYYDSEPVSGKVEELEVVEGPLREAHGA